MASTTSKSAAGQNHRQTEVPVLISGAGPVGLLAGIMLTRMGIPVRIIERDRTVPQMSKALSIHARTLEILDMTGLIDRFLAAGYPISRSNFYLNGELITVAGLVNSISHYNYALFLEQLKTIAILEEELERYGVKVDRGWELVDTKVIVEGGSDGDDDSDEGEYVETILRRSLDGGENDTPKSRVDNNNNSNNEKAFFGTTDELENEVGDKEYEFEVVRSRYLIAADGGKSVVRHKLEIPFVGQTVPNNMILFDGRIESDIKYQEITVVYGKNNEMFNIFPLSDGQVRIMIDGSSLDPKEGLTHEKLEKLCQACAVPYKIKILDSSWLTFYKVNERRAQTYSCKHKRIFLAGDAAHVHSPVGGQGMNVGLQDAYNISWKIALVLNGLASKELLETYEQERIPVADDVISMSSRLFAMGFSHHPLRRVIRKAIISVASYIIRWITVPAATVSMLSIRYHENFLNRKHDKQPAVEEAYKVGQRAHDAALIPILKGGKVGESIRLHQLFHGPGTFHIVVFTSDMLSSEHNSSGSGPTKRTHDKGIEYTNEKDLVKNMDASLQKWRSKWAYGSALAVKADLPISDVVELFNVHVVAALPEKLTTTTTTTTTHSSDDWVDTTAVHADVLAGKAAGEGKIYLDDSRRLHAFYGVPVKGGPGAIVVVRPDSHIGYRVAGASAAAWQDVDAYFCSILKS
ncbi:hypothetical protein BGZ94_004673 [Podila epigama]|nr:hypothetical protein BGZ94_004673 [Podila epigama]